jgi:hypothetical protein
MKNPMTPAGIELGTLRFVAQDLNHCATAVPGKSLTGSLKDKLLCSSDTDRGRPNCSEKSLSQSHFFHHGAEPPVVAVSA